MHEVAAEPGGVGQIGRHAHGPARRAAAGWMTLEGGSS